MRGFLIAGWTIILLPRFLCAQVDEPISAEPWEHIRAHQPPALHLNITLTKDRFFQGEQIDAIVKFSNDDANRPCAVAVGTGTPGAVFRAVDANGKAQVEPLGWFYSWYGITITGPVGIHPFGNYALKLPLNETVRFDSPGSYSVYALATVTEGADFNEKAHVELVSDKVKITVVGITPEEEKATIEAALGKFSKTTSQGGESPQKGIAALSYLQTRAARDQLIALLGRHDLSGWVHSGLLGAPDPTEEAARILTQVQAGKLVLDENGAELYGELKTSEMIRGSSPSTMPEKDAQRCFEELGKARTAAQSEVLAAAIEASGKKGPSAVEALWSAFEEQAIHKNPGEPDRDGGKARREVAAHQLELSSDHVKRLLETWAYWGSGDFLPLVRREAAPPANNLTALIALAGLKPQKARAMIIADLSQPEPRLLEGHYAASTLLPSIQPMPLPQFDELFRHRFVFTNADHIMVPVISCFGSAALLPDMVKEYNGMLHSNSNQTLLWDDGVRACFFHYWFRCDPKAACLGLEQEVQSRPQDGAGFLSIMLQKGWTDDALPVIRWAIQSSDLNLVGAGISLLTKHGDDSNIDLVITSLERMNGKVANPNYASEEAGRILQTSRWHYNDVQRARLVALAGSAK
jgi:hypothetical protein